MTRIHFLAAFGVMAAAAPLATAAESSGTPKTAPSSDFPKGTATPSEECGACHVAIYREFATGFGSDLKTDRILYRSLHDKFLSLPARVSSSATLHATAGEDPFPAHAREIEEKGNSCNVCHFPQAFEIPDMDNPEITKPLPRPRGEEKGGLTCASCHLTPEGKIRGPHQVDAPHAMQVDPRIQTSAMCAFCHSFGKRVVGKQTQTFLEWREDFSKPGLGRQQCQDCHMPRTLRQTVEDVGIPTRAAARHLWTGGHSRQRLGSALSLVVVQPEESKAGVSFHVINIGAGHSVPTGSNRRAVYLQAEVRDDTGKVVADREWMFAPWYGNRPDDRAFLEEDKTRPDAVAATQADAQGPHEPIIRAGEERVLTWAPTLSSGHYTVLGVLVYDLNRYNDRAFKEDQSEMNRSSLSITVK
jgi:nitrate/TMAO reductase-like tetraheme cytochrome c subunit